MSRNARNLIFKECDHGWKHLITIGLLELFGHVITDLTDAMKCSVSDLGIWVTQMLNDNRYHGRDILDVVDIFADL